MDVNNTPYFLIREAEEFSHRSQRFVWDSRRQALVLAQSQDLRLPAVAAAEALPVWQAAAPLVQDKYKQLARISADGSALEVNAGRGFLPLHDGELQPVVAPHGSFVDLGIGGSGRLFALYSDGEGEHGLLVFDLGLRWQRFAALPEAPRRACVDDDDHVWVLAESSLYFCAGQPLPQPYQAQPDRFEPLNINPQPLRLHWQQALPAGQVGLALCADADNIYLLCHDVTGAQRILRRSRVAEAQIALHPYPLPATAPFVIDLGLVAPGRLAAVAPRQAGDSDFQQRDCPVFALHWDGDSAQGEARLIGERYPMLSQASARFVGTMDGRLYYQADSDVAGAPARPRPLQALRRPQYPSAAQLTLTQTLDSGQVDTLWHRLYLEGCIPPGCRIRIYAKVFDNPELRGEANFIPQPELLWNPLPSERAYAGSLCESRRNESGLFELLLQRPAGRVRRLSGRYLQLRIRMEGDGRHSPAIHALRVYYPRFSYQEAYLPEHFRQEESWQAGDTGAANGADVRERFLAAFEGVLTPLEGRVAAAETLLNPDVTPAAQLPWLAELLGQSPPAHWPLSRQRRYVREVGALQRRRGTLAGLQLALDIVTDGAVARGQVVLVENFRLRRTMATILGIDMDDGEHPLTLGTGMSGNSIVGDSLILSEEDAVEFLALFAPELAQGAQRQQVEAFFDRYSHRVSVLLHGPARTLRDSVAECLDQQMPAHLGWQILETDHPFVLGLAPLLAVDSYLEVRPAPHQLRLDDTYLGKEGLLKNPLALSPQDVNRLSS